MALHSRSGRLEVGKCRRNGKRGTLQYHPVRMPACLFHLSSSHLLRFRTAVQSVRKYAATKRSYVLTSEGLSAMLSYYSPLPAFTFLFPDPIHFLK